MGAIVLTCPVTGDDFSTGIDIDRLSFEAIPDAIMRAYCPHCGQIHPWRSRQSKWVESVPAPNENVIQAVAQQRSDQPFRIRVQALNNNADLVL